MDAEFTATENASGMPDNHKAINVTIHYEIYDGISAMAKWMTVRAPRGTAIVQVTTVSVEILALNEPFSRISTFDGYALASDVPDNAYNFLHVETNKHMALKSPGPLIRHKRRQRDPINRSLM